MPSQRRRGASRQLTPLMSRILAVAYPDLDGRVRTSQQTQGASSGGGEVASEHEGAASHMALEGHATDSEYTSGTEGEGSSTAGTRADVSGSDSSSEGSSLVVAATSVPPATTGAVLTVVFCAGVRVPGRGAGIQQRVGCVVRVPCCPDSSWGVWR
ncbi:hypothetical protein NDU88_000786 [Pleurodeles waltl]|uniref:Uncharacterized protein n=1 Tax=Pleurodeles waltl TaxID=8319 RepID=A0AAV7UQX7_PLEWA|nr:hypothetical protein NDU88_000786 [Pleurodeles waltl]